MSSFHATPVQPTLIDIPSKPQRIKLTQDIDFFALFKRIEREFDICYLLESLGEDSHISRHHAIGFDPIMTIAAIDRTTLAITDNKTAETTHYQTDNPYELLRKITPQHVIARDQSGGLVGYLGYDCVNFFEPSLNAKSSEDFEPFKFGVYLDGLTLDKMTGEIFYFYYPTTQQDNRIEQIKSLLDAPIPSYEPPSVEFLGDGMSQEDHAKAVMQVKEDIVSGRIFQCEVGFKSKYRIAGDKMPIYEKLRAVNPSPHMYFMKFSQQCIIGASPELLFRLRQGEMETYPLAGTAKRGVDVIEDRKLARALLNDAKEIAEHNMLVDLHRNDIGRVAQFGTVKVRSLMDIKRFSHVQHISSEIVGILHPNEDMFSALASNFPAGTLSGAPKIEAIKVINELEPDGRGAYGGALGSFNFNGDCIFAIPIRSLFINGESAYAQTCGGNVYDSNPADEYLEIQRKLSAMKVVLDSFMNP
ncbi:MULTISPECIES: anthranilate synthase component I family protein [Psychrobacter]|uniref:Anthranilate synthase, aminase component n=1 Tax=Psychrobacter alimentarius TaxID=261164 RepID=A0ABM6A017_9GAMM|nr:MULTISPECIES: anthranilate synthase component I family protein [Psychrobacter]AMT97711.1 Anthranilate synthase, aminase component [Psychrobacter alimentarius]QCB30000.1 anthranilate synthase component I family protein [Psychrobacter sp. PAMC27889]